MSLYKCYSKAEELEILKLTNGIIYGDGNYTEHSTFPRQTVNFTTLVTGTDYIKSF